jgi:predicted GTPase
MTERRRVLILGAGGRDFHNFNTLFRNRRDCDVVAFTATQIPFIDRRVYPPEVAGPAYPRGIPIFPEEELGDLIRGRRVDEVVFSYSDVSHDQLMETASRVLSLGAAFRLPGPAETMLRSRVPVLSVCAIRTGCGKSVITRKVAGLLSARGVAVSVVRHPMAYCGFEPVVRFGSLEDVDRGTCTLEEREEFEPLVRMGLTVFAGVDYEAVLGEAEKESQVILWDGGNNDFPFFRADLEVVLLDGLRPGHERHYYPGEVNLRRAHFLLITKTNEATREGLETIHRNIALLNPDARMAEAPSAVRLDHPDRVRGKRVLVVEDGPTVTHGGMAYGAGAAAARAAGGELIDPRPFAVGSLKDIYRMYPHLGPVLPAVGYSEGQVRDLAETINGSGCEAVVVGTPIDLGRRIRIRAPIARAYYDLVVDLNGLVTEFLSVPGRFAARD